MAIKIRKRDKDSRRDPKDADGGQANKTSGGSDPVLNATVRGASWLENNRNLVVGGIIAVLVAVIGVWVGASYVESQNVEASSALSPALWESTAPIEGTRAMEQIKQSERIDPPETVFESDDKRWQSIYNRADKSISATKSGPIAQTSRLTKAAAANRLGKFDEAIDLYQTYLDGETNQGMLPFVYLGLATAHGAKGDVQKASQNYDKLVEQNESYQGLAMYQKAQVFEDAGKTDEAKDLYHEILDSHPQSPYRTDIERRLALL